jgi:uncharacterized cupin superfamily protein
MSDYTIVTIADTKNWFKEQGWPGEMRFLKNELGTEQVSISYRKMPWHSGGKGGYGHKHKTQEEVIYVMKGEVEVKLDDKIEIIKAGQAIRISPAVVRSIWNDKPEEVELLIVSKRVEDLKEDVEYVQDFWPED